MPDDGTKDERDRYTYRLRLGRGRTVHLTAPSKLSRRESDQICAWLRTILLAPAILPESVVVSTVVSEDACSSE